MFKFKNISSADIYKASVDFVLRQGDTEKERLTEELSSKKKPLFSNGYETDDIAIKMGQNILTKKELEQYYIDIYVYKDEKFKTLIASFKVLELLNYWSKYRVSPHL